MSSEPESLGDVRETFQPKLANIIAGSIVGLIFIAAGLTFAVGLALREDQQPLKQSDQIAKYFLIGLLGLTGPIGGSAMLWWMKRLAAHRVVVRDAGFVYIYGGTEEVCPWQQVTRINEIFTQEQLKLLKVPGASIKRIDRSFSVIRADGKEFGFTVNSVNDLPRFGELLEAASQAHNIPWEQVEQS